MRGELAFYRFLWRGGGLLFAMGVLGRGAEDVLAFWLEFMVWGFGRGLNSRKIYNSNLREHACSIFFWKGLLNSLWND